MGPKLRRLVNVVDLVVDAADDDGGDDDGSGVTIHFQNWTDFDHIGCCKF